jgi:hypothetical protein
MIVNVSLFSLAIYRQKAKLKNSKEKKVILEVLSRQK